MDLEGSGSGRGAFQGGKEVSGRISDPSSCVSAGWTLGW